jgi:hypothetical protein
VDWGKERAWRSRTEGGRGFFLKTCIDNESLAVMGGDCIRVRAGLTERC